MTPASVLGGPRWFPRQSPRPPGSGGERGGRQVATGREAGAGDREGAKGAPTHRPAAAPLAGRGPNHPPAAPSPGSFLGPQAFRSARPALTHPQAAAGSGNKTSPTAGLLGRRDSEGDGGTRGRPASAGCKANSNSQSRPGPGPWPGPQRTASSTPGKRPPAPSATPGRGGEVAAPFPIRSPRDSPSVRVTSPTAVLPPGPSTQPAQSPALGVPGASAAPRPPRPGPASAPGPLRERQPRRESRRAPGLARGMR